MERRDAIQRVAYLMGGVLSAPAISGILSGCQPSEKPDWLPEFFTKAQDAVINEVTEVIIPTTDTPGAKAAQVNRLIDLMIKDCYTAKDQETFKKGVDALDAAAKEKFGDGFAEISTEQKNELFSALEKEAFASRGKTDGKHFYFLIKELTLLGYFTSEIGATQALKYLPVPGDYKGCIPYSEVGKAWAT